MPERIANTDPNTQITEMIGSGPYRFIANEYVSGNRVAYEKFSGYKPRQEQPEWNMGAKIAHFDRIVWKIIPDASTAAAALQTGEVDWWEQALSDLVPVIKRNKNLALGPGNVVGHMGILRFNHLHPPFNNRRLRQVILLAVNQTDYMATVTGGDSTAYKVCHSYYTCGTPYGRAPTPDPMAGKPSIEKLKQLVKESGYAGEKIIIINPTDYPTVGPFGQITHALFQSLGLNAELVETDWGGMLQRRSNKGPVTSGGWSVFHTWWTGETLVNPAMNAVIRGQGEQGWAGWYQNAQMEALNRQWLEQPSEDGRAKIAANMQDLAFQEVPAVPLGLFSIRTAYHRSLAGFVAAPAPNPWGVRRV